QDCYCDDGSSTGPQDIEMSDHPHWESDPRAGMLAVLTLVGCVILAGAAAHSFRDYYAEAAPAGEPDGMANRAPNVSDTGNAPQGASRVIHDPLNGKATILNLNIS